ncbi:MAG TPA: hypothetical protein VMF06_14615 [Candidatus Limnocylindria bacterium]|jgi:hypothetical protein|nr:hypothetical protein [Candidatus Limnocylindria bacterium]
MNRKSWLLLSALGALAIFYAIFFTDWFDPTPIQISYQVRPTIAPPRFRRPMKPLNPANQAGATNHQPQPLPKPEAPLVDPAPGGVAYVTFSLDDFYQVDFLRVWEITSTNSEPRMIWSLKGKSSRPLNSLLYGRVPDGLVPQIAPDAETLKPNTSYKLEIRAGRHHGDVLFNTAAIPTPEGS